MKRYQITVTDNKTKSILVDEIIRSLKPKCAIEKTYKANYRFHPNVVKISVTKITETVKQLDLLEAIKEIESDNQ